MKTNQSAGFFNFTVGALALTAVTDGHVYVKRIRQVQQPESSAAEIEAAQRSAAVDQVLAESFVSVDVIDGAINMLVIQTEEKIILIDAGFGYMGDQAVELPPNLMMVPGVVRKAGKLLDNLLDAGISTDDITDIILTHAHIDHLGGILDTNGNKVFKNAAVHIAKIEYDFWTSENPDFSNSRAPDNLPTLNLARYTLGKIVDDLVFFNDGDILFNSIEVIIAPGHTPGQAVLRIFSGVEELLHIVDIAHTPEMIFPHPEWGATLDTDFYQAIATRRTYFEKLAQSKQRAFGCHLPWPGLGFVRKNGDGYQWVPQTYSTPQLFDY